MLCYPRPTVPRLVVIGTTGAGKSEFLQSLLTGLAATHSPERITFLLVDYKGGSAFTIAGRHEGRFVLENNRFRAGFDPAGSITSVLKIAIVPRTYRLGRIDGSAPFVAVQTHLLGKR